MSCTISCIMPVYNATHWLSDAVTSVLSQSYSDFELILVDDGSTDGSGTLCDQWAEKDSRIHVLHQQNRGVSSARNAGLDAAEGKILCFVDADDVLRPDAFSAILPAFQQRNRDLVSFGMDFTRNSCCERAAHPAFSCDSMSAFWNYFVSYYQAELFPSLCNKAYRADMIRANRLRFDRTRRTGEDMDFNLACWGCVRSFEHLDLQLYEYRLRPDSLSRCIVTDRMDASRLTLGRVKNFLHSQGQGQLYPLLITAWLPWEAGRFFDELTDPGRSCSRAQRQAGLDKLFRDEMWHSALLSELSKRSGRKACLLRFSAARKSSRLATFGLKDPKK